MIPAQIKVKDDKYLFIKWDDDSQTEIPLDHLRRFCPCAICTSEDEEHHHDYIKVYTPQQLTVTSVNLVGKYAIAIKWADNHNTGIYEFSYINKISSL